MAVKVCFKHQISKKGAIVIQDSQKNDKSLLEDICRKAGCMYISDLHRPELLPVIQSIVKEIDSDQYCLWEWNDAAAYITGEQYVFANRESAFKFINNFKIGKEKRR